MRFHGDRARAAAVYEGVEPLTGADTLRKQSHGRTITGAYER